MMIFMFFLIYSILSFNHSFYIAEFSAVLYFVIFLLGLKVFQTNEPVFVLWDNENKERDWWIGFYVFQIDYRSRHVNTWGCDIPTP